MFGLFKPKLAPEGPVEITADIEIERPASEVYPLLDWADERNAKRALGSTITPVEGQADVWHMTWPPMPELNFEFTVTEAIPHTAYAFGCSITPRAGKLAHSHESYRFEDIGEGHCILHLTETAQFINGLTEKQYAREVAMMAKACQQALIKLKIHAEHGPEVAAELEGRNFA